MSIWAKFQLSRWCRSGQAANYYPPPHGRSLFLPACRYRGDSSCGMTKVLAWEKSFVSSLGIKEDSSLTWTPHIIKSTLTNVGFDMSLTLIYHHYLPLLRQICIFQYRYSQLGLTPHGKMSWMPKLRLIKTKKFIGWWELSWISKPKLLEIGKFARCWKWDQSRLGKRCWYRDFIKTLDGLWTPSPPPLDNSE